ncbi:MAG TPA: VOC family protein [Steroidobacter sp.]|jgi:catechol 2,3-dioxygenase-like lactoylglutathione lyase family enzyme|nr:VOC family protein [Steroidobacter sp.]
MARTPIHIREIDHIVLRTADAQRLRAFYCDLLGCSLEKVQAGVGLTQLRAGRSLIDLLESRNEAGVKARNMDHFCLRIEPFDAEAIGAFLRAHGVDPGTVESRYGAEGEGPSMYVNDPDGNVVELKGPPRNQ